MVLRGEISVLLNPVACENHLAGLHPWKFWFSGSPGALSSSTSFISYPGEIYPKYRWYHIHLGKPTGEENMWASGKGGSCWQPTSYLPDCLPWVYFCLHIWFRLSGFPLPFWLWESTLQGQAETLLCLPYPASVNLSLSTFLCSPAVGSCLSTLQAFCAKQLALNSFKFGNSLLTSGIWFSSIVSTQ